MIERAKVGITDSGQFVYAVKDTEGNVVPVRKDQIYMKEYTDSKSVIYRLFNTKERIIKLEENDMIAVYKRTGKARKRDEYPVKTYPTSTNLAGKKFITRYFAQNKISDTKEIIEVEGITNSTSYNFVQIKWQVAGSLKQAKVFNERQLIDAEGTIQGISDILPLDQLHISKFMFAASLRPEYQNQSETQAAEEQTTTQSETTQTAPAQPQSPTGPPPGVVTGGAGGGGY